MESEGDMNYILDTVLCATINDEQRFFKILKNLIRKKELPAFDNFLKESKGKKAARRKKVRSVFGFFSFFFFHYRTFQFPQLGYIL